ncbi:MAG: type II toxin-antitoxin system VapC family toxin [Dehalococcoidia bacterium]
MTRLDSALGGISRLGFDTSPFIYLIERHQTYLAVVREVFRRVDTGTIAGFSSVISLTEVLTRPMQIGDAALAHSYRLVLTGSRHFTLLPIDSIIAERAARLRARHRLRTPDAMQLATALSVGCEAFLTNDATLRRVSELRVILIDELDP